jgi:hypothetical protein
MKELIKPILLQQYHVSHYVERIALAQKFQTCIYRTGVFLAGPEGLGKKNFEIWTQRNWKVGQICPYFSLA